MLLFSSLNFSLHNGNVELNIWHIWRYQDGWWDSYDWLWGTKTSPQSTPWSFISQWFYISFPQSIIQLLDEGEDGIGLEGGQLDWLLREQEIDLLISRLDITLAVGTETQRPILFLIRLDKDCTKCDWRKEIYIRLRGRKGGYVIGNVRSGLLINTSIEQERMRSSLHSLTNHINQTRHIIPAISLIVP